MNLYPLLMAPHFRSGAETPWGGSMLRDAFMKDAPEGAGESMEISALKDCESTVRNGAHAGVTLTHMIDLWGESLTGVSGDFPLLLKLLDAQEALSVQVHPDDDYARAHEGGKLGKTEAWVILNCDAGAKIAYGLNAGGKTPAEIYGGDVEAALNWINVRPGDVYYIPSGLAHAIGGGIQLYEIQQSSDVTYRVWDWNRLNVDGQPRQLHVQQAAEVTDAELRADKLRGVTSLCRGGSRTYYISDSHFELCRLNVSGEMPVSDGRMLLLTPLGSCRLRWSEDELELMPFDSVLVPAALENVIVESDDCKVLMASLPRQEALRDALGYRAEGVAGL